MPSEQNWNAKIPGSSSSISLNDSPSTDEFNYDSDISEDDDHAIAEGDDDDDYADADEEEVVAEEEEETYEGFEVEVSTLTGSTFNVMIRPSDTVEVLKTRIAFQEGISPADQNLLMDQGKLLEPSSGSSTIQELNIDRYSKLTLVTNVATGVSFGTTHDEAGADDSGVSSSHTHGNGEQNSFPSSQQSKLAPALIRNYHSTTTTTTDKDFQNTNCSNAAQAVSSTLRLPKILTAGSTRICDNDNNGNNYYHLPSHHEDRSMHNNSNSSNNSNSGVEKRLDEREWMQSLFNKVIQQEQDEEGIGDIDEEIGMDSTTATNSSTGEGSAPVAPAGRRPPGFPRYAGNSFTARHEEDGNILIVQGDDGVILIIQKNTGQLVDDSLSDRNNNNFRSSERKPSHGFELEFYNTRTPGMERYQKSESSSVTLKSRNSFHASKVHEKIKENAVTLEKMRHVRTMMAQKNQQRVASESGEESSLPGKNFELPKISTASTKGRTTGGFDRVSTAGIRAYASKRYGSQIDRNATGNQFSYKTGNSLMMRSINSSKMSLNRLIAEIYLQSKKKCHAFQPGQPPYTEQQLLRYVQLKVAILLDEQWKSKTGPCSKCQLDDDWIFDKAATYLIPTVVMSRYRRLANGRATKSLETNMTNDSNSCSLGRKTIIGLGADKTRTTYHQNHIPPGLNDWGDLEADIVPAIVSTSTISRSSTSTNTKNPLAYPHLQGHHHSNSSGVTENGDSKNTSSHRERMINQVPRTVRGNINTTNIPPNFHIGSNSRPSLKLYPKIYGSVPAKKSSRPGK